VPPEFAVDTSVLVNANVKQTSDHTEAVRQAARLLLLQRVQSQQAAVLISRQLVAEYKRKITSFENDYVRLFLELLTNPDGSHIIPNWRTPWTRSDIARMYECRFPYEDDHVLRTAARGHRTTLYSEERRILGANARCVRKHFGVDINEP
jgi:hypothetical protein